MSRRYKHRTSDQAGSTKRWLQGYLVEGFALRHPVLITVWSEGFEIVADAEALNIHAFGRDETSAVQMLKHAIVERYRLFESLGDRLSDAARAEAEQYRQLILAPDA